MSDGHIHSSGRQTDNIENFDIDLTDNSIENRLKAENGRLRKELSLNNHIMDVQNRRINELETTLERTRNNESLYSVNLAQSMEKVEENMNRTNVRPTVEWIFCCCIFLYLCLTNSFYNLTYPQQKAAAAQSNVTELKKKVKQLTVRVFFFVCEFTTP